ncbi:20624_t:CDS:2 [Dentiscutata erythropus]|uniref:20624_t:CDS:1 n=1 Tax=Dentiscutata erythropus TaxID=1348616 RepID=A0A9N8VRN0_9GLOM|nr:20624_t:CDS:2 [Dentiscutata erythropus]
MEHTKNSLPRFQMFILGVIVFSEAISSTFIFPFIYFMGILSDKYGRRPILLLGLLGSTISCLLFGLSHSLWQAIFTRSISGFLNGDVIGEISNKHNEARAYSIIVSCWSMGFIIGPMIGGYLSNPVLNYPSIFANVEVLKVNPNAQMLQRRQNVALLTSNYLDERGIVKKIILNVPLASWVVIFSYSILGLKNIIFDEVYPICAITDINIGGFGLSTKNLALTFASMGITQIGLNYLLFPLVNNIKTWNHSEKDNIAWLFLLFVTSIRILLNIFLHSSIAIFINNSVRSNSLGKVNGIAQTAVAITRSIGPLLGGLMWTWSLSNNLDFPFDGYFSFIVLSILSILGGMHARIISDYF